MILMYNNVAISYGSSVVSYSGSSPEPVSGNTWSNDCKQVDNFTPDSSGWYTTALHDSYATIVLDEPSDTAPENPWNYARMSLDTALDCSKGVYVKITAKSPSSGSTIGDVTTTSANPTLSFRLEDSSGKLSNWVDVSRNGSSGSGTLEIITDASSTGSVDNACWYTLTSADLSSAYCSGIDTSAIAAIHFELANFYCNSSPEWKTRKKALMFKVVTISDTAIN